MTSSIFQARAVEGAPDKAARKPRGSGALGNFGEDAARAHDPSPVREPRVPNGTGTTARSLSQTEGRRRQAARAAVCVARAVFWPRNRVLARNRSQNPPFPPGSRRNPRPQKRARGKAGESVPERGLVAISTAKSRTAIPPAACRPAFGSSEPAKDDRGDAERRRRPSDRAGPDGRARKRPYAKPHAARNSSTLSVRSQVNSGNSRPKWP